MSMKILAGIKKSLNNLKYYDNSKKNSYWKNER